MGMVKKEFVEYEIGLESMEAGLEWMTRYGVKTFKDYTGEWVETRCAREVDLFSGEETPIAHLTMETA
jgi:hypothetical protein